MIKLSREQKKEVVIVYQEDDLLETILFCEEKGYITKEQSKEMIDNCRYNPYPNEDNYYYVVFVLGRDLIKGIFPYEDDTAYDFCKKVANDFEKSSYNVNTKGLYECLEEYVRDNFYLKNGEITWKGEKIQ